MSKRTKLIRNFDVIEHLMELAEQQRLNHAVYRPLFGKIFRNLECIEKKLDEVLRSSMNKELQALYINGVENGLGKISSVIDIKGINTPLVVAVLNIYTNYLCFIFNNCLKVKNIEHLKHNFSKNFSFLDYREEITSKAESEAVYNEVPTPSEVLLEKFLTDIGLEFSNEALQEYTLRVNKRLNVFSDGYIINSINWDKHDGFNVEESKLFIELDFVILDHKNGKTAPMLYPLYVIIGALEQIENITVSIVDIRKGSLVVKLFLLTEEIFAKDQAKATLINVQKLLSGEDKVLDKVLKNMQVEIDGVKAKSVAELELQKLQIAKESLEIINKISEMIAHTILTSDNMELKINKANFIKIVNGRLHIENINIDEITE